MASLSEPTFIAPDPHIPRVIPRDVFAPAAPIDSRHNYKVVIGRFEQALATVEARIRVDPSSRAARWRYSLRRIAEADKRGVLEELIRSLQGGRWNHAYRDAFVALVESRTFVEIVEQLGAHLTDGDLHELISGHPDPSLDSASARGRDKEFEWFIAVVFRRAGLHVALAEPDLLIKVNGEVRSLAAKRVGSRRKLDANISRASAQIAREEYPGYVVLDLTKYVDPSAEYIEHWREQGETVMRRLRAVAESPSVRVRRNNLVQGVFLRAAYPHISRGFEYGTADRWVAAKVGDGNEHEHRLLCHMLVTGMRGT